MRMSAKITLLIAIVMLTMIVLATEARGGRGGGGSFGRLFGSLRKYKKHSSSSGSSSRRTTINGSPVHSKLTKSVLSSQRTAPKSSPHSASKSSRPRQVHLNPHTNSQPHVSYPRGQYRPHTVTAPGHNTPVHFWGGHQLPQGHLYLTQPSSIPTNAIYYAQPPRQSSSSGDDFFMGYILGRRLSHPHHTHHHTVVEYQHPSTQQANENSARRTIIIKNNGENKNVSHNTTEQTQYWPTETYVPLEPFNVTLSPDGPTQSTEEAIFQNSPFKTIKQEQQNVGAEGITTPDSVYMLPAATAPPPETSPPGGIICIPWLFNETDANDPQRIITVEKTICFPAPPPPPLPPVTPLSTSVFGVDQSKNCTQRIFIERDPNDMSKMIEVQREYCPTEITPGTVQIAGEIGSNTPNTKTTTTDIVPTATTAAATTTTFAADTAKTIEKDNCSNVECPSLNNLLFNIDLASLDPCCITATRLKAALLTDMI